MLFQNSPIFQGNCPISENFVAINTTVICGEMIYSLPKVNWQIPLQNENNIENETFLLVIIRIGSVC